MTGEYTEVPHCDYCGWVKGSVTSGQVINAATCSHHTTRPPPSPLSVASLSSTSIVHSTHPRHTSNTDTIRV